ncbi:hypothetical protein V494_06981 [Pseudogymnoascus sp. VKM F-4513 (FW-928)]|nr:hypothetical protein V494_06981 [Pseudogymnoascus sp. VKM F-4513 (FW-928)]
MDRFLGKLKKKAGGGRNKAGTDKAHSLLEASGSPSPSPSPLPSPSLSTEPKTPDPVEPSFWHSIDDQPREAFETTLRPPVAPSGDRHSNYRPYRRAPETPPAPVTPFFPPGFSSHPYESSKKSYPPPRTSEKAVLTPTKIKRKELPKNDKPTKHGWFSNNKTRHASATSEAAVHEAPLVHTEPEPNPDPSTRNAAQENEGRARSVGRPSLDSEPGIVTGIVADVVIQSKAEKTAELLAKKYARLVHQQEELHAEKYMRIIKRRAELESRGGILWPTNHPPVEELPNDERETHVYEFPQFVPKPLALRKKKKEPQQDEPRPNQRQVSAANGDPYDYEAAKLESWKQFYGKGEMMEILHNEIDEYLGAIMFQRLLKETAGDATRESTVYRSEVTVRKYWDGAREYLGTDLKSKDV